MEPGRDDREHVAAAATSAVTVVAAMEPGRDDREHQGIPGNHLAGIAAAAMEPGRDDREHPSPSTR